MKFFKEFFLVFKNICSFQAKYKYLTHQMQEKQAVKHWLVLIYGRVGNKFGAHKYFVTLATMLPIICVTPL